MRKQDNTTLMVITVVIAAAVILTSLMVATYTHTVTGKAVISNTESEAQMSVTIVNNPPNVTLISPINNTNFTPPGASMDTSFTCNVTDDLDIANVSLFMNLSGEFTMTQNVDINGTTNETLITFNVTGIPAGAGYIWNCQACDGNERCSFAPQNFTFTVGPAPPPEEDGRDESAPAPAPPPPLRITMPIPPLPPLTNITIIRVTQDDRLIYSKGNILDKIQLRSTMNTTLLVTIENSGTSDLHNLILLFPNVPSIMRIKSVTPAGVPSLRPLQQTTLQIQIESTVIKIKEKLTMRLLAKTVEASEEIELPIAIVGIQERPVLLPEVPRFFFPLITLGLLFAIIRLLALNDRIRDFLQSLFQFFYKVNIADEGMVRLLIRERRISHYARIHTTAEAYNKYRTIRNLRSIPPMKIADRQAILSISRKYGVDLELARLIHYGALKNRARFMTVRDLPDTMKKDFKKIEFINPLTIIQKETQRAKEIITKEARKIENGTAKIGKELKEEEHHLVEEIKK